jgi:hypothetical protein
VVTKNTESGAREALCNGESADGANAVKQDSFERRHY